MKPTYITGGYKWFFKRKRVCGNKRLVAFICKGKHLVAVLFWHPSAKQIILSSKCCMTAEALGVITPFMVKKHFYNMSRLYDLKMKKELIEGKI